MAGRMQGKVAFVGKGGQGAVGLGFLVGVVALQGVAVGLEVGLGQSLRNVLLQRLHRLGHALAQLAPLAGRQAQGARPLGRVKSVQVTQVGRGGAQGGGGLHLLRQQGGTARADVAQHKQVVVGLVQGQAKASGGLCPFLANPGQRLVRQLARVGKAQPGRVHFQPQGVRRQARGRRQRLGGGQVGRGGWGVGHGLPGCAALALAAFATSLACGAGHGQPATLPA